MFNVVIQHLGDSGIEWNGLGLAKDNIFEVKRQRKGGHPDDTGWHTA